MKDRRRSSAIDSPLLLVMLTLASLVVYLAMVVVAFTAVFNRTETPPDGAPAGGRAACEPVAPRINGAFTRSEVAAESTSRVAAPP